MPMNTSNHQAIYRLFHTDEERNAALDDEYDVELAMSIMRSRHARNLTQKDFAEQMKVSQSYIAQLENADVLPSHKKLKEIARVLQAKLFAPRIIVEDADTQQAADTTPVNWLWKVDAGSSNSVLRIEQLSPLKNLYDYQTT